MEAEWKNCQSGLVHQLAHGIKNFDFNDAAAI
jgi:hypothetical protein